MKKLMIFAWCMLISVEPSPINKPIGISVPAGLNPVMVILNQMTRLQVN